MRARFFAVLAIAAFSVGATGECSRSTASGSAANVVIDSAVTRVRLTVPGGASAAKTELVLRDIRFDTHPGTQFHVVLEKVDDPTRRARVGTLNFYAAAAGATITRTFDATDELRELAQPAEVVLVLEATTGRGNGNAETTFDPDTRVTITEVALRRRE